MIRVVLAVVVPIVALVLGAGGSVAYRAVTGPGPAEAGAASEAGSEAAGQGNIPAALSYSYITTALRSVKGQLLSEIVFTADSATAKGYGSEGDKYIAWTFDGTGKGTQDYSSDLPLRMSGYGTFEASRVRADVVHATVLSALELSARDGKHANSLAQAATGLKIAYDRDWHADVADAKAALITVTVSDTAANGTTRAYCWTADGRDRREPQS